MPRIDLTDEEAELIKERRRKREVTDTWNEAAKLVAADAVDLYKSLDTRDVGRFERLLKHRVLQHRRVHKS